MVVNCGIHNGTTLSKEGFMLIKGGERGGMEYIEGDIDEICGGGIFLSRRIWISVSAREGF